VQVTRPVSALSFQTPKFGTCQRYIFSDVEPITTMMDPPSSFIFENHPIPLEASSFVENKTFLFFESKIKHQKKNVL
jgi:hypothetical protein